MVIEPKIRTKFSMYFEDFQILIKTIKGTAVDLLSPKVEITGLEPATFRLRT